MATYVKKSLVMNEEVKYEGAFALMDNFFWILISLGLLWLPIYFYQRFSEIAVTNFRVVGKKGIIRLSTYEFALDKIESIDVKQSILGRIFGYGSIILTGSGNSSLMIPNIKSPQDFRNALNNETYN